MIPLFISHAIILAALVIATITDFKSREVPDYLNFSLMAVGVVLGAVNSLTVGSILPLLWSVVGLVVGYLFGALMFYTGQWGGGDAKMLMGMGAVLGVELTYFWQAGIEFPLFFTSIFAIFIAGSVYGMAYGLYLMYMHRKAFKKAFLSKIREPKMIKIRAAVAIIVVLLIVAAFASGDLLIGWTIGALAFALFFGMYLIIIGKLVEKVCMIKTMKVKDLTEGEWIAEDVVVKGITICGPKDLGIKLDQIKTLKELKVKTVVVKQGIPFIPGFLLGYILLLIVGNVPATLGL